MRSAHVTLLGLLIVGCASRPATPAVMVQGGSRPVHHIPVPGLTRGPVPIDMVSVQPPGLKVVPGSVVAEKSLREGELGSRSRPIQTDGWQDQHEYIRRLRCPGGGTPFFYSNGSLGPGARTEDPHPLSVFTIECPDVMPFLLYMDKFHVVRAMDPIPGFTILPFLPGRAASGCPPQVTADPDSNAAWVFNNSEIEKPAELKGMSFERSGFETMEWHASFVVDTLGRVELESLRLAKPVTASRYKDIQRWAAGLRFTSAEHRPGCKVRALFEMGIMALSTSSR